MSRRTAVAGAALCLILLAALYQPLEIVVRRWGESEEYSHGYLVPLISAGILWRRRGLLVESGSPVVPKADCCIGVLLLAIAAVIRVFGRYDYYYLLEAYSLLPGLLGIALLVGGRMAARWAWPGILFLVFMYPLPSQVEQSISIPLRRFGASCSVWTLQTMGQNALAEGTTIRVGGERLDVADACSGLKLLLAMVAMSTAYALICERPAIHKFLLLAGAIPVSLLANVMRLVITGLAYRYGAESSRHFFHDFAGLLMIPTAAAILAGFSWHLGHLFPEHNQQVASDELTTE